MSVFTLRSTVVSDFFQGYVYHTNWVILSFHRTGEIMYMYL
jgi:hypothetical protein